MNGRLTDVMWYRDVWYRDVQALRYGGCLILLGFRFPVVLALPLACRLTRWVCCVAGSYAYMNLIPPLQISALRSLRR